MAKRIYFVGILANVGPTIISLKLDYGFKVKPIGSYNLRQFVHNLTSLGIVEVAQKLVEADCINLHDPQAYIICKSFLADYDLGRAGELIRLCNIEYLRSIIEKIRLFKEGNIYVPFSYFYFQLKKKDNLIILNESPRNTEKGMFNLTKKETRQLNKFIRNVRMPLQPPYLQLAFENLEDSYHTNNTKLSFLSSMIALEILFAPEGSMGELKYRISRNAAVFLGKDLTESKGIFKKVKELYDKRSNLVHTGNSRTLTREDLLILRKYVRDSIKKMIRFNQNKDGILEILNQGKFGSNLTP